MKPITGLIIAVVFIVGCLTGGAMSSFVVPKVRAGTNPQKWEYKCFVQKARFSIDTTAGTAQQSQSRRQTGMGDGYNWNEWLGLVLQTPAALTREE